MIVNEDPWYWRVMLHAPAFLSVYKYWPDDGLVRPKLVSNTYLLTYFMLQSPSWEANRFAASQEIPRISRNPKVHYRTHKFPLTVSIVGQPSPVHILTSHLLDIRPNIFFSMHAPLL